MHCQQCDMGLRDTLHSVISTPRNATHSLISGNFREQMNLVAGPRIDSVSTTPTSCMFRGLHTILSFEGF